MSWLDYMSRAYEFMDSLNKGPFPEGRAGWCRNNDHNDRKRRKDKARELTRKREEELKKNVRS